MSNLSAFSMWDLFRGEVEAQMRLLTDGLLALERGEPAKEHLASTMRAAHSIKGAGRIVQLDAAVTLAHAMEDCLVAAQEGRVTLQPAAIDVLLTAGDLLMQLSKVEESDVAAWVVAQRAAIDDLLQRLGEVRAGTLGGSGARDRGGSAESVRVAPAATAAPGGQATSSAPADVAGPTAGDTGARAGEGRDRTLKVGAQTLNRLMGLAGESLVQSRWFEPFSASLLTLKRRHSDLGELLERLQTQLEANAPPDALATLASARQKVEETRQRVTEHQRRVRRVRSPLLGSVRPALSRGGRDPDAGVRRRRGGLPATGARPGATARQGGADRDRRPVHRGRSRDPRAPGGAAEPRHPEQRRPRHRAARRTGGRRQAADRHDPPGSAPPRGPVRADGLRRRPRRGHRARSGPRSSPGSWPQPRWPRPSRRPSSSSSSSCPDSRPPQRSPTCPAAASDSTWCGRWPSRWAASPDSPRAPDRACRSSSSCRSRCRWCGRSWPRSRASRSRSPSRESPVR